METNKPVGNDAFTLAKRIIDILFNDPFARHHSLSTQSTLNYPDLNYSGSVHYEIKWSVGVHPPELSLEYKINKNANIVGVFDYMLNTVVERPRSFSIFNIRNEWIAATRVTHRKILELLALEGFSETTKDLNVLWRDTSLKEPQYYLREKIV